MLCYKKVGALEPATTAAQPFGASQYGSAAYASPSYGAAPYAPGAGAAGPVAEVGRFQATTLTFGLPARIAGTILASLPLIALVVLIIVFRVPRIGILIGLYMMLYRPILKSLWRRSDRL